MKHNRPATDHEATKRVHGPLPHRQRVLGLIYWMSCLLRQRHSTAENVVEDEKPLMATICSKSSLVKLGRPISQEWSCKTFVSRGMRFAHPDLDEMPYVATNLAR
jgi:hypothetical protein